MSAAQARNTHLVRDNAAEYGIGICEQSSIHTAGGHPAACISDRGGIRNGESLGQFQPPHSPFSWRHDTTWLSWWCSNAFKSLLLLLLLCGRRTVLRRRLSLHDGSSLSSLAIHSVISAFSLPFISVSINRSTGRRNPLLLFSASGSHCLLLSFSHTYFSNFSTSCPARKKLPKN
jgi:hypothetical protein